MINMDDVYKVTMLMDFYGQLLTERQNEILDLYYNNDYSLAEISEHLEISRQGVYDNIKRSKVIMMEYEKKLGLVKAHLNLKKKVDNLLEIIQDIDVKNMDSQSKEKILKVKTEIDQLIN